jgi:hypothetical protein
MDPSGRSEKWVNISVGTSRKAKAMGGDYWDMYKNTSEAKLKK